MRGGVDFIGIGVNYATFKASGLTVDNEGAAVTMVSNDTVGLGTADQPLVGKVLKYENDDIVSVQYAGFAEFDIDTTNPPSVGGSVVVDGTGKVKAAPSIDASTINVYQYINTNIVVSVDTINGKAIVLL